MYGSTTTLAAPPRVNLLPPEIAEIARVRKAKVAMLGTGLAAVAVVGVMYTQAKAQVSQAKDDQAQAVAVNVRLRGDLTKLQNVKDVYAQVDLANKTLASAMHYEVRWSTYLNDLRLTIPENVFLKSLRAEMTPPVGAVAGPSDTVLDPGLGTVTFTGAAFSHDDVATWLESLTKQKGYADPYFTKAEARKGTPLVDFDSTVYLTEKALSKRYAKGLDR